MPAKTPPFPAAPSITTAKFWGRIRASLRQVWLRFPARQEALNRAKRQVKIGKRRVAYECAKCHNLFKLDEVEVHHIEEAGTLRDFGDLEEFVRKLFCHADKLQVVCKECHKEL